MTVVLPLHVMTSTVVLAHDQSKDSCPPGSVI